MKLVFLHGPAAVGKYTVGTALSRLTGQPLFHNHLAVDAALALFDFGSPGFIRLRAAIWRAAFAEAARANRSLIFTFQPEASVAPDFVAETVRLVETVGGEVLFVRLTCPVAVQEERLVAPSRAAFRKLRYVGILRQALASGGMDYPALPDSGLTIDTTHMDAQAAAHRIIDHFGLNRAEGAD